MPFRFKQFEVNHDRSSMKVGVDGVLLAMWVDVSGCHKILDAGCGCGVIALICAQRTESQTIITAVDIHQPSIEEASGNFKNSPWGNRMSAQLIDFQRIDGKFDLIVSNPPYFSSGIDKPETARLTARHESDFGPHTLIDRAPELLTPKGCLAMVIPIDRLNEILEYSSIKGLIPRRICKVRGSVSKAPKRVMLELSVDSENPQSPTVEDLTIEHSPGVYTEEYLTLGQPFYLKF